MLAGLLFSDTLPSDIFQVSRVPVSEVVSSVHVGSRPNMYALQANHRGFVISGGKVNILKPLPGRGSVGMGRPEIIGIGIVALTASGACQGVSTSQTSVEQGEPTIWRPPRYLPQPWHVPRKLAMAAVSSSESAGLLCQVPPSSATSSSGAQLSYMRSYVVRGKHVVALQLPAHFANAFGQDITNDGTVAGYVSQSGEPVDLDSVKPVIWLNLHASMLPLPSQYKGGMAMKINRRHVCAGVAIRTDLGMLPSKRPRRAVLWVGGKALPLPMPNTLDAEARRISDVQVTGLNDNGQVCGIVRVGSNAQGPTYHACLWKAGRAYDLNKFIGPHNYTLVTADAIDNQGRVFCTAYPADPHATQFEVVLSPRSVLNK